MKMYKSKLRAQLTLFSAFESYSKIIFQDCELTGNIVIHPLSPTIVPKFSLYIYQGSVSDSIIHIEESSATFTDINMTSVKMLNVLLSNLEHSLNTNLFVHLENLTWENTDKGFIDLFKVISVNIDSSLLTGTCHVCTLINVQGKGKINKNVSDLMRLVVDVPYNVSTLSLVNTSLDAQGSLQNKINIRGNAIILRNNTFTIAGSVSFYVWNDFEAENLLIQCSTGQMVQRALGQKHVMYTCIMLCDEKTEYSLQAGKLIVSESVTVHIGDQFSFYFKSLKYKSAPLEEVFVPSCQPCPIGAKCYSFIQVLPNYWGNITPNKSLSIFRCPDAYCCQGNDTCGKIDSCNIGRIGTLCGTCDQNLTETMLTTKCVPTENCRSAWIITLFISAALLYTIILLSFSTIKNKLTCFLKNIKAKCTNNQTSSKDPKTDESGLKYMQILFYYIQDSKLFIVYLPQMDGKSENFLLKFFEFSPRILETYVEATELCFKFLLLS